MSVEAGATALAISTRLANFSYPAAIASIVDRASASRILSARLLTSAARAIHCGEVGGSSIPCPVAHPTPVVKSHLSEHLTTPTTPSMPGQGGHPGRPLRLRPPSVRNTHGSGYGKLDRGNGGGKPT